MKHVKLPNFENAYVPEAKIVKYLLNQEHRQGGKEKAVFFLRFDFTIQEWVSVGAGAVSSRGCA